MPEWEEEGDYAQISIFPTGLKILVGILGRRMGWAVGVGAGATRITVF